VCGIDRIRLARHDGRIFILWGAISAMKVSVCVSIIPHYGMHPDSMGAVQAAVVSLKINASCQTRPDDWMMRMRFQGEITREVAGSVRVRLSTRAFHPEARSHHPITAPSAIWARISAVILSPVDSHPANAGNF